MRYKDKNQDSDLDFMEVLIKRYLKWVLWVVIFICIFWFGGVWDSKDFAESAGAFGTIGDYFGGTLNPFLAFMAFLLLTHSIRLQLKEMSESRLELKKSAEAQSEAAKAQLELAQLGRDNYKIQNDLLVLQKEMLGFDRESQMINIFEKSFYNLLEDLKVVNGDKIFDFYVPYDEYIDRDGYHVEAGSSKYAFGFEKSTAYLLGLVLKNSFFEGMIINESIESRRAFRVAFLNICSAESEEFFFAIDSVVHKVYQVVFMVNKSDFLSEDLKVFYIEIIKKSLKSQYKIWIFLHSISSLDFDLSIYAKYEFFTGMQISENKYHLMMKMKVFYK